MDKSKIRSAQLETIAQGRPEHAAALGLALGDQLELRAALERADEMAAAVAAVGGAGAGVGVGAGREGEGGGAPAGLEV
jgi:hypothetical protein